VLVCLRLVFQTGELPLESTVPTTVSPPNDRSQQTTNLLWTSVVKVNLILDIKICPPVTNLCSASQTLYGQHWESKLVVDGDLLLVLLDESGIRGGWEIMERSIRDSASALAFGRNIVRGEGDLFGLCVTEDRKSNSPRYRKTVSHDISATSDFRCT